jgi:hypothetical protein
MYFASLSLSNYDPKGGRDESAIIKTRVVSYFARQKKEVFMSTYPKYGSGPFDPDDITTYRTTMDIYKSRRFSATERKKEYIRRGKSPSGVVDGEYNDTYLDDDEIYNDENRDWDADA